MKKKTDPFIEEFQQAKEKLLRVFRKWYGCLSVRELAGNPLLVHEIENFEKLILLQGV